jgi:hypothetical protein
MLKIYISTNGELLKNGEPCLLVSQFKPTALEDHETIEVIEHHFNLSDTEILDFCAGVRAKRDPTNSELQKEVDKLKLLLGECDE